MCLIRQLVLGNTPNYNTGIQYDFKTILDPPNPQIAQNDLKGIKINMIKNHYYVCSYIVKETQSCIYKSSWMMLRERECGQNREGGHVGILRLSAKFTRGSLLLFSSSSPRKSFAWSVPLLSFHLIHRLYSRPLYPFTSSMIIGLWGAWGWGDGENADWERDID